MIKSIFRHFPQYLPLLVILSMGALAFVFFSYDQAIQIVVVISTAISYVVWGIVHHSTRRDLYLAVVVEYLAVASLGLVIAFSLIFRT